MMLRLVKSEKEGESDKLDRNTQQHEPPTPQYQFGVCPSGHVNLIAESSHLVMSSEDFYHYVAKCLEVCSRLESMGLAPNQNT